MISEFPLLVFTSFAGLAAGAYSVATVFPREKDTPRSWLFPLVCLILLGIGLIGCLTHLQHPERFMNALVNPTAGIAQEAYLSIAFGLALVVDVVLSKMKGSSPRWLQVIGALCAVGLTFVMGYAYFVSNGVPVWTTWATIPLFVVGDVVMGASFYALFNRRLYLRNIFTTICFVLSILTGVVFAAIALYFFPYGINVMPIVAALILTPVLSVALILAAKADRLSHAPLLIFACSFVGVVLVRYVFYSACGF